MRVDIIIIDDDPVSIFVHETVIKKSELITNLLSYSSGLDALNYLDNRKHKIPSLLLLDINMPLMSGWKLLEQINLRPYAELIFAVIISSSVDVNDHKKAKTFKRVIDCLEKPINVTELLNKIESFLSAFPFKKTASN